VGSIPAAGTTHFKVVTENLAFLRNRRVTLRSDSNQKAATSAFFDTDRRAEALTTFNHRNIISTDTTRISQKHFGILETSSNGEPSRWNFAIFPETYFVSICCIQGSENIRCRPEVKKSEIPGLFGHQFIRR